MVVSLSVSRRNVCGMSERQLCHTSGGVRSLGLHVVLCPKYRRPILDGRVAARCGELPEQIAVEHGWEIVAKEGMPGHVHLVVRVGPTDARPQMARVFKGRMARVLRSEFGYVGWFAKVLWSLSYFAASMESTVRRYVENQCYAVA